MIQPHNAWTINDSTKLKCYLECPRKFFYEHRLGWSSDEQSNHLVFGDALHQALEHIYRHGFSDESLVAAHEQFMSVYRLTFGDDTDALFHPKDPVMAFKGLAAYAVRYKNDFQMYDVLHTEVGGTAPINTEGRRIAFKIDTIVQSKSNGKIQVLEHKTKGGGFNHIWGVEFPLSIQVGAYTHALYCLFDPERVQGVEINGIAFIKRKADGGYHDFMRVPCWRQPHHMNNWLWNVNRIWDEIDADDQYLMSEAKESDDILQCYGMNPTNCSKYFRKCDWHDFCSTWSNPLQNAFEPPMGYHVEFWDPRENEVRERMDLDW